MKKGTKIIALVLAAVLLVGATVFGTMAYLTSKATVTNTFTVGNVAITLDEAKVDANGKEITGEGAERVKANGYKLIPGVEYDKDPTVTVLKDSEESYVRMLVTINKKATLDELNCVEGIDIDLDTVFDGNNNNIWLPVGYQVDDDARVYEFRYFEMVDAREEEKELESLFKSSSFPAL